MNPKRYYEVWAWRHEGGWYLYSRRVTPAYADEDVNRLARNGQRGKVEIHDEP